METFEDMGKYVQDLVKADPSGSSSKYINQAIDHFYPAGVSDNERANMETTITIWMWNNSDPQEFAKTVNNAMFNYVVSKQNKWR
jgi:alpha-L-fucosidase